MRLAVLKERRASETRVAATPDTVKKLVGLGLTVADRDGRGARRRDRRRGIRGRRGGNRAGCGGRPGGAGIVFAVQVPEAEQRALIPRGALLLCTANAFADPEIVPGLAEAGHRHRRDGAAAPHHARPVDGRAVEPGEPRRLPRGDRGGGDVRARLPHDDDGGRHGAAGAGVRHRRGRRRACRRSRPPAASAPSSRRPTCAPPSKEEIKSLGAAFVGVEDDGDGAAQTGALCARDERGVPPEAGGADGDHVAKNDIIICTALVMGRKAPIIVTAPMVESMRPGSVIVDLAAEAGGNCEATVPGEASSPPNGVTILGYRNWPARIPVAASRSMPQPADLPDARSGTRRRRRRSCPDRRHREGRDAHPGGAVVHPQFLPSQAA